MSNTFGPVTSSGATFELVGLAGEQVASREIRPFTYVEAFGVGPHYTDIGFGIPVLLEPVPVLSVAPASINVTDPATPVVGSFVDQGLASDYSAVFARSIWLFDHTGVAPVATVAFGDVSVVTKTTWTRQCPDGYFQQVYHPEFFPHGVASSISLVCPLVPDPYSLNPVLTLTPSSGIHNAYPGAERVSDGFRYKLAPPVAEVLAGTYVEMITGLSACAPLAADLDPMLDDAGVCP